MLPVRVVGSSSEAEPHHVGSGDQGNGRVPQILQNAGLVFWEFDGVVKDSVEVKTEGFRWLVRNAGPAVCDRVQRHHESNGGVSRFDKIPLYLTWADMPVDTKTVQRACVEFSKYVTDAVINSPWVPGVPDNLQDNPEQQLFVLVTATPHEEIIRILRQLNLLTCFSEVFGTPTSKIHAVARSLAHHVMSPNRTVFVGDSVTDFEAATSNGVPFLLRRHKLNRELATSLRVPSIDSLVHD